jgi:hypothetical protein
MATENRKPLNFAQALRSKPRENTDSQPAERQVSTEEDSQLSTTPASQQATAPVTQIPPPSLLPTAPPEPAIQVAKPRKVDSHRRKRVDSRKGDRHRGDKVPFNNRISEATYQRIKHFLVDHDMEQQEFAELSAIHFMDAVDSHREEKSASGLAPDEREMMILFKTQPSIINLYLQYNPENRWKPADDYEGQRYNDKDIRLIEFGIIQTQFNARFKKINSFKYYTTEIDIALETPLTEETIEVMMKHARRRWREATGSANG